MLLIESTIKEFGYDPSTLASFSHKFVIYECNICKNHIKTLMMNYTKQKRKVCFKCNKTNVMSSIMFERHKGKGFGFHKQLNDFETFKVFGYKASNLKKGSDHKVFYNCINCSNLVETNMKTFVNTIQNKGYSECRSCITTRRNLEFYKKGFAYTGEKLGHSYIYRKIHDRFRKLFYGSLKAYEILPYTKDELVQHINNKLILRDYTCPLCGVSLNPKFTIDHKIPLSSANNKQEIIDLFKLSNLDVLCGRCNSKKSNKRIDY